MNANAPPGSELPEIPAIDVVSTRGPAMIQDLGRRDHMHEGVPPGGALVPEWLARANRLLGNPAGCAAIESFGELTVCARAVPIELAFGARVHRLQAGERITIPRDPGTRVTYVALAGGVDVPAVLGGRGTLLVAGLGGLEGRLLRGGDVLRARAIAAPSDSRVEPATHDFDLTQSIRVIIGPDSARFPTSALDTLLNATFTISATSDRVGLRLRGERLVRIDPDSALSMPMVHGAIQVPASGEPIVLGPDHPTTGGYPVIATVISADSGAIAARSTGAAVNFRAVTVDQAREALRTHRTRFPIER